jgi:hypothetical protein
MTNQLDRTNNSITKNTLVIDNVTSYLDNLNAMIAKTQASPGVALYGYTGY